MLLAVRYPIVFHLNKFKKKRMKNSVNINQMMFSFLFQPEVDAPHPMIAAIWSAYWSGSVLAGGKQTGEMASE